LIDNTGSRFKRPTLDVDKESPEYVKGQVEKSFQVAASYLKDPGRVRHPSKRNAKLIEAYPLIPDLDAFPDAGGYMGIKFLTNPVPPSSVYDIRLENSLFRPIIPTEEEELAKAAAREAHNQDPTRNPAPDDTLDYEFFLTETPESALAFKRKFDVFDPEKDEEEIYTERNGGGAGCFRFKRIRDYESASQIGTSYEKYDDEVMIAIHDGTDGLHQKAAHYYPMVRRIAIRPQRNKNIHKHKTGSTDQDENVIDFIDVRVEEPEEEMVAVRDVFRDHPYGKEQTAEEQGEANGAQLPTPESQSPRT